MMGGMIEFELPTGEKVSLIYGAQHPGRGTSFPQGVRAGAYDDNSAEALAHRNMLWVYQRDLTALVRQELPSFDAIVTPPSCRQDADPYRSAIAEDQNAMDLTSGFTRLNKYKAGDSNTTVEDMVMEFVYKGSGKEAEIKELLIVDESISSGKTVAAMLVRLREAGLPEDCRITVAVWTKLRRS
jgi:hypothetical protein